MTTFAQPPTKSLTFEASYRGVCFACGDYVERGDIVLYNADDELIHEDCDGAEPSTAEPCGRCFMVPATNGTCGCE